MARTLNTADHLAAIDQLTIRREMSLVRLRDLRAANEQAGLRPQSLDETIEVATVALLRLTAKRAEIISRRRGI